MVDINLRPQYVKSLRPRRNARFNADDIFKRIFLKENVWIPTIISLTFVPMGQINNIQALDQILVWSRPGDKPLSEPMMISSLTHICVTRPQWVNKIIKIIFHFQNMPNSCSLLTACSSFDNSLVYVILLSDLFIAIKPIFMWNRMVAGLMTLNNSLPDNSCYALHITNKYPTPNYILIQLDGYKISQSIFTTSICVFENKHMVYGHVAE